LFLEGPARERREVKVFDRAVSNGRRPAVDTPRQGILNGETYVKQTLADSNGNIARQIDYDGYRYKFEDSELVWTLAVM